MTTTTAKSQKNRAAPRPVKRRVLRGLIPLLLLVFVIVNLLALTTLRNEQQQTLAFVQRVTLTEGQARLSGVLDGSRTALSQIAANQTTREFAAETVTTMNQDIGALQAAQTILVNDLTALIERERGQVLLGRYIMRTGSVWTEVRWDNGIISNDLAFNLNALDPSEDAVLQVGQAIESGQVAIADFRVDELASGSIRPVMTLVTPITRDPLNSVLGVLELQVDATNLLTSLDIVTDQTITEFGQRLLLVDEDAGRILADTDAVGLGFLLSGIVSTQDAALIDDLQGLPGFLEDKPLSGDLRALRVSAAPLTDLTGNGLNWRLVLLTNARANLGQAVRVFGAVLLINALASGLVLWYVNLSLNQNLRPIKAAGNLLNDLARNTPTDRTSVAPSFPRERSVPVLGEADEHVQLYQAVQQIAGRLEALNIEIDEQTTRYNRNLKVAARIGRETALLENLDDLLNRAIDLIATSFDLYHAQVFLVDDAGVNAILRYSRGEAGERLLAYGHRLAVGSQSVIGRVTATGQAVIVNNTVAPRAGTTHAPNPLLPDTRAEMALPLQIGDQILGALDLQSDKPDVFQPEDEQTFQLIADQVAIAIYKTRLLREAEERVQVIQRLNRQMTQKAWSELEREVGLDHAYRYNLLEVKPFVSDETQEITRTAELMAIPIRVRGEVIGTMHAAPPEGMQFTEGDYSILSAVAERVAVAVENARLFQKTQTNLAETSALYQTTRALNEADSLHDIIQAVIKAAMPEAVSGQIALFDEPGVVRLLASWTDPNYADSQLSDDVVEGQFFVMDEHPLLAELSGNAITIVQDTLRDKRLTDDLRKLFWGLGSRALVFIPLNVRGSWRGFAQVSFPQPREFTEREGRIFTSLIGQAGVAIDNRLLLQQTEDALSQNERLYAGSRSINQAIGLDDLVRAAVLTSDRADLNFGLALFEGDIDRSGWSRRIRHVSQSQDGIIRAPGRTYPFIVDEDSPIRDREPGVVRQGDVIDSPMQQTLLRIFGTNGDTYGTVFPLFSANQPIALFFVSRRDDTPLTEEDMEIYRALAGMMSTVIQNRNLLDQMGEALDETRRLYEASRAITDAQDLETMFEAAVHHLTLANLRLSRVNIFLAGPEPSVDAAHLDVAYSWVAEDSVVSQLAPYTRLDQNAAPFGQMTADRGAALFYVRDIFSDLADYPRLCQFFDEGQAHSVLISALNPRQQWLGVLTIESQEGNAFDESYQRFVDALGDQVAIAVENQMLFQESQQQARQALALAEASSLANQIGVGLTEAINTMFQRVAETAGYDRWLLMLEDQNELYIVTQHTPDPAVPLMTGRLNLSTGEHSLADAVRFNRTMVVNKPAEQFAFRDRPSMQITVGKHIATPIIAGENIIGALMVGRGLTEPDMADRDEILVSTISAQVAVSVQNQRLFQSAENERKTLSSILSTLPAGVLVLDGRTLIPLQYNDPVVEYLGRPVDENLPFTAARYAIYRTGTTLHYPNDELPIVIAQATGEAVLANDLTIITEDGHFADLLMNAAPIRNAAGEVVNIVVALEDISNLRALENNLQDNLRETISLYEATRALTSAEELNDVLDVVIFQLGMLEPGNAHLILRDQITMEMIVERSLYEGLEASDLPRGVLEDDNIFVSNNIADDDFLTEADRQQLVLLGVQAIASVPLTASRRTVPLGWLIVIYEMPYNFTPEDERFISTLGDNAAVAVDNRYLFQSTQEALRETSLLYSATRSISRAQTMEGLSEVVQGALVALTPDAYAAYLMTDPSSPDDIIALFNVYEDGPPLDFQPLLTQYGLFREENIYIEDLRYLTDPSPFEQALQQFDHIRAVALVSLRVKGMPDGRLFLAYNQPRSFHEGDTRYLNAVADSASVIVDNVLLVAQIQQTLEETSTLYQSSRALANATTPVDVMDVVVKWLAGPHVNQVFVALLGNRHWDDPNAAVEVVSSWQRDVGIDLQGVSLTAEQFPAWTLLASSDVVTVDDVTDTSYITEMEQMGIESLDTRSLAIIPLRVSSRAIGTVWIGSTMPHTHTEGEQRVYKAFMEQASLSLEASFLLDQTGRRARQLETSNEVSQIASSILDLDKLMPRVVNLIRDQFGYDHVQIFLMDAEDRYAMLRASTGEAGKQLLSINHKLEKGSQSVIGQVTLNAEPTIALDTSDARVIHRPNPYLPLTRSEMALPIINKDIVIGALDVQSNHPNAFGEEDVRVLRTLAAQISVAIDNARLYEKSEQRVEEMGFLFSVTSSAANADTVELALQNVVDLLLSYGNTLSAGVYLIDEESEAPIAAFRDSQRKPSERQAQDVFMRIVALAGSEQPLSEVERVRVGDTQNLLGTAAENLNPLTIADVREVPTYLPLVSGARSAIVVPQTSGDRVIGLVVLESDRVDNYNEDNTRLLLTLSGTLAAIVDNARLLEQIQESNEELKALDRIKSDFLANMSHELRTPLNSIIGFSRVMLKGIDGDLSEMQEQDLTTIYKSGQHLLGLINDILDQAKIAADKMDLDEKYFDIGAVAEGVRSIGIGLLKEKPVDLFLEMANQLPKAFGDEFRTRQALLNIVSNASKFTSEGSITISVYTFEDEERGLMVRIDVADTGIGIAEKDLPLLFEAFRQVDSSLTRTSEGTGLGLPITRSLIELQGGEMFVESEVNVGSTFSITVPTQPMDVEVDADGNVIDQHPAGDTQEAPAQVAPGAPANGAKDQRRTTGIHKPPAGLFQQKRQILLIMDEQALVDQLRRQLQPEGFEVQVANHPMFAETMASGLRPTLIIMDVRFAEDKGWGVLEKLKDRDDTFDIPVIVVTIDDDSERAYQLGAYAFVQRPFLPNDMRDTVLAAEQDSNIDRILIIDDQEKDTRLLEQLLAEHGKYRVFAAHTGPEGISLVARRRPDLIILDLRMPQMDGFAVLEELRRQPEAAGIPVVVVTGETTLSNDEREQLAELDIVYKADLQHDYDAFIAKVKEQIANYHGDT